jgi:hypothetical protein
MIKAVLAITFVGASAQAQLALQPSSTSTVPLNPVIQWNRNLLAIVRTPGAQPGTIHPTRSFAMMHAAIYDAVDAVDRTHQPYRIQISGTSPDASQEAAAAAAAHEVLIGLYPKFQVSLDLELQQSLEQVPDGPNKGLGIAVGQLVADQVLTLRNNDGADAPPTPFVFGGASGNYQSTPPNFPQPQFTQWSDVTPFALQQASQFRPGPPPPWRTLPTQMRSMK